MQHVQIATQDAAQQDSPDSLFGICQRIGEDMGFNSFYLRVSIILLAVFSIPAAVATYAALALAVGASRVIFPVPGQDEDEDTVEAVAADLPIDVAETRLEPELIAA